MRVLIIGGTGLISTSITRQLFEQGVDITLFNRGITDARIPSGPRLLHGDRRDSIDFEEKMSQAGMFDCVIDMVCYKAEEAISLIRAFRGRTGQVILCSSVEVYSKAVKTFPIRENEARVPIGEYAAGKIHCEDILMAAGQRGDFPVTILRPGHTYGEGGVIVHTLGWGTTYLDRIRKGKPVIVHGDGSSLWVSCHIDDVGRAFMNAVGNASALGKVYHVTGAEWRTWNGYHQGVAEAMGAPEPRLVHIPTDVLARVAPKRASTTIQTFQFNNIFDTTQAEKDLSFRYSIPWVEGVRRTVAWLDAHDRIENSDDDPLDDRIINAWEGYEQQMVDRMEGNDR
jgi:nucleoside-diphosphate-sugar epimerase